MPTYSLLSGLWLDFHQLVNDHAGRTAVSFATLSTLWAKRVMLALVIETMIYILPGMGANSSMYSGPWLNEPNLKFLDWPKYQGEKTISEVAERIINLHSISKSDSIGGSSLGGMVALEIGFKLGIEKIYLFGSAISKTEINPIIRLLSPLAEVTPLKFIQAIAGKYENNVLNMFSTSEPDFIRSMCHAIAHWQGFKGDHSLINRIHGAKDRVIVCQEACKKIKEGGHLIAITHPHQCIEIIKNH